MEKIRIGELIKKFRLQKKVTSKQLCEGLCDESIFFKYEKGQAIPNILLLHRFMERMGMGVGEFAVMLSEQEYEYFNWREHTLVALETKEWEKLEKLLEKNVLLSYADCSEKLEIQYRYYLKAIIEVVKYKDRKKAITYLEIAIKQTIPNFLYIDRNEILLGELEVHILILYLYYGMLEHMFDNEYAEILFESLEQYLSDERITKSERAKFYPKLICVWMKVSKERIVERKLFCEKAVNLLRETKTLYDIVELLKNYVVILEEWNSEQILFYKKHLEIFTEIFNQENIDITFYPELITGRREKLFLINEYLLFKRMEKDMTQEKTSEGICAVETYSRIETGKRVPSAKNLYALAERLEIGWCYYRGELETDSLKVYELRQKHRTADIEGAWEDELYILQKMEHYLDMQKPVNYQYVKAKQLKVKQQLGLIAPEEAYEKDMELLSMTTVLYREEKLVYYSQTELEIIGHMAQMLRKQKRYKETIALLEHILTNIKKSKVIEKYQWNGIYSIIRVLSGGYFDEGRYEEALKLVNYLCKMDIKMRDAGNLPDIFDAIADNLEHMGERYSEEYRKLYRQTYYLADFFHITDIKLFTKKYYEKNFDSEIKWY